MQAAEQRAEFRRKIDASSLGAPDVQDTLARQRHREQALPEAWTQLSKLDLVKLLGDYRDRRETWHEDHETALLYVLCEIDFEPSQSDLSEE